MGWARVVDGRLVSIGNDRPWDNNVRAGVAALRFREDGPPDAQGWLGDGIRAAAALAIQVDQQLALKGKASPARMARLSLQDADFGNPDCPLIQTYKQLLSIELLRRGQAAPPWESPTLPGG